MQKFSWEIKIDLQARLGDWNWRIKLPPWEAIFALHFIGQLPYQVSKIEFTGAE